MAFALDLALLHLSFALFVPEFSNEELVAGAGPLEHPLRRLHVRDFFVELGLLLDMMLYLRRLPLKVLLRLLVEALDLPVEAIG